MKLLYWSSFVVLEGLFKFRRDTTAWMRLWHLLCFVVPNRWNNLWLMVWFCRNLRFNLAVTAVTIETYFHEEVNSNQFRRRQSTWFWLH